VDHEGSGGRLEVKVARTVTRAAGDRLRISRWSWDVHVDSGPGGTLFTRELDLPPMEMARLTSCRLRFGQGNAPCGR